MTKRVLNVQLFASSSSKDILGSVEVVGKVSELVRLALQIVNKPAIWHGPGEPKKQSRREFLRRHPEVKE